MPDDIARLTAAMAKTMVTLNQQNSIQYAASSLPVFDGEKPKLSVFTQQVEDGLALLPAGTEKEYLAIVLTKLTGPARISTRDKEFSDIASLIKHLKKRYAPGRNVAYFQGEISRLRIRSDESLRKYIDRTSHLAYCTRTAVNDRYGRNAAQILTEMEKDLLENFIEGLPEQIGWRIVGLKEERETLEDAFEAVLRIERRIRNRRQASEDRLSRRDYGEGN